MKNDLEIERKWANQLFNSSCNPDSRRRRSSSIEDYPIIYSSIMIYFSVKFYVTRNLWSFTMKWNICEPRARAFQASRNVDDFLGEMNSLITYVDISQHSYITTYIHGIFTWMLHHDIVDEPNIFWVKQNFPRPWIRYKRAKSNKFKMTPLSCFFFFQNSSEPKRFFVAKQLDWKMRKKIQRFCSYREFSHIMR